MTDEEMERKWVELKAQIEGSRSTARMNGIRSLECRRDTQKTANIPDIYQDAHLGNFRTPIYADQDAVKVMNGIIREWYKNFDENFAKGKGLYLWSGTKGSGKTRMAISLLNEIMVEHGKTMYFSTSTQILNEIKETWDSDGPSESELLRKLIKYQVLVIDDFGTEIPKDWINERFYHIVNERYNAKQLTIYTSNHSLEDLKYDDRIIDRIYETTYVVPMPEESIRRKLALAEQEQIIKKAKGGQGK